MSQRRTVVSTSNDDFLINGTLTFEGIQHGSSHIEGLLLNSRMVQGTFDDRNPETLDLWNYPDGPWDPARNTREFVDAMPYVAVIWIEFLYLKPAGRKSFRLFQGTALGQFRLP